MEVKVLFLFFILTISRTLSIDEVPEFQYPCYIDVCTFPKQYCNSEEKYCSPCSRALCHAPEVPTACRYICIKYDQLSTTTQSTSMTKNVTTAHKIVEDGYSEESVIIWLTFSVVVCSLMLITAGIGIFYYFRFTRKSKQRNVKNGGVTYSSVESGQEAVPNIQDPGQLCIECPTCGHSSRQRPHPENHQTILPPDSFSSPPSYKAVDTRKYMRPHSPIVTIPSDSDDSVEKIGAMAKVVTTKTRHPDTEQTSVVTQTTTEGDNLMHEKPCHPMSLAKDLQGDMLDSFHSNINSDNTLRKVPNAMFER